VARYRTLLDRLAGELADVQRTLARTRERSSEISQAAARLAQAEETLRAARAAEQARNAVAERAAREATVAALPESQRRLAESRRPLVAPSGRTPVRVGDTVEERPVVLQRTNPEYSAEAMAARVEGVVGLEVLVDEEGRVADAKVIRSIPLLDESALRSIRRWRFSPTRLKGELVPVIVQVEMNFTMK
jgi:TonB family protein